MEILPELRCCPRDAHTPHDNSKYSAPGSSTESEHSTACSGQPVGRIITVAFVKLLVLSQRCHFDGNTDPPTLPAHLSEVMIFAKPADKQPTLRLARCGSLIGIASSDKLPSTIDILWH
jgi:hypothetical protein